MVRVSYPNADPAYEEFYENQKWQGERGRQAKRRHQKSKRTKPSVAFSPTSRASAHHLTNSNLQARIYWKNVSDKEARAACKAGCSQDVFCVEELDASETECQSLVNSALLECTNALDLNAVQELADTCMDVKPDGQQDAWLSRQDGPNLTTKLTDTETAWNAGADGSWLFVNNHGEIDSEDSDDDFEFVDKVIFA